MDCVYGVGWGDEHLRVSIPHATRNYWSNGVGWGDEHLRVSIPHATRNYWSNKKQRMNYTRYLYLARTHSRPSQARTRKHAHEHTHTHSTAHMCTRARRARRTGAAAPTDAPPPPPDAGEGGAPSPGGRRAKNGPKRRVRQEPSCRTITCQMRDDLFVCLTASFWMHLFVFWVLAKQRQEE